MKKQEQQKLDQKSESEWLTDSADSKGDNGESSQNSVHILNTMDEQQIESSHEIDQALENQLNADQDKLNPKTDENQMMMNFFAQMNLNEESKGYDIK